MIDVVIFQEVDCDNGKKIGLITLNSPKSLNALSSDMVALLYPKLVAWQQQQDIAAVFLQGEGDKAFCAGGDIVHLYSAMKNSALTKNVSTGNIADKLNEDNKFAPEIERYFTQEYQLDFLIHTFNKPFIVWGSGIVMGGGLGMLVGASHRVVTESSRIAMPEISIGLFPDVGASYFLNKMPSGCGLFLALTGASINAADAKYCQLADYFVEQQHKDNLLTQLKMINWGETIPLNHDKTSQLLQEFEQNSVNKLPVSVLKEHQPLIGTLTNNEDLTEILAAILGVQTEDKWFNRAQKSLKNGSALSAQLAFIQLNKGKGMALADCFRMELDLAVKCGYFGEFSEGVRALLIDKDNRPQWQYPSIGAIDSNVLNWFFESSWSKASHPLAKLS
ncbi:enoyl-CoA hydratase/isomerase family protein [Colwellia psychrerythraea]|uniref:3-hydroxyisobutyryl-CoA hydrolase n=1 Tax=Colwellia psychrerythraea TaxID=28229 RepID=A0A099KNR8_COLPS|nr:enoyl-CoA hydratase/isomerase family protein [Colwellia psychrerythraea]KGJ91288.1 3-hydroxyisobutyryl-CoA hydrolase [Colwellia psychrerythraea]